MNATLRARRMAAGSKPRSTAWDRKMQAESGGGQRKPTNPPPPASGQTGAFEDLFRRGMRSGNAGSTR